MNLRQKLDKRCNQLRSASFNGFAQVLQDFWRFFDKEPMLFSIGENLRNNYPDISKRVVEFFEGRIPFRPDSTEESAAFSFEILRRVSGQSSDIGKLRGALMAGIYPTEFGTYEYKTQPEIDRNYLLTFIERYLDEFCLYIEEQLEDNEIMNKTENSSINHFHAPVGAVQTGNNTIANVNQNIGQNFSEILEQLSILRNQFHSLPNEERAEAIEVIEAIAKEVQSETPSKGKIKSFLSTTKNFAVKTGTELAASTLAKLLESQMGIKG